MPPSGKFDFYERNGGDKYGKSQKNISMVRENVGNCYFCGKPVYISEGQIVLYKRTKAGESIEEYPTHKSCRRKELKERKRY